MGLSWKYIFEMSQYYDFDLQIGDISPPFCKYHLEQLANVDQLKMEAFEAKRLKHPTIDKMSNSS